MKPEDEFFIKLKKAVDHFEGANELGMDRAFAVRKLLELSANTKLASPPVYIKNTS